ncbi:MlaE family ABC transporter permease [Oecophyllibacter saccharovorans]|uniref:MlaE family ABC transporter permease n=1 Tax=Oecophyllibacter saccharovorans TaxID=2558360 RepID=UPI0011425B33|nr:ABC transporter permease [Oecophyllibacter saccharovorans]QDH15089.1 ABC transporter permease [Oecophyllibacter saccharovorans]TPW35268.1 ABC transporter permease [Oecophyllibacter saccharovorans]
MLETPFVALGRLVLSAFRQVGSVVLFGLRGLSGLVRPPFYWKIFLSSLVNIGFLSLPVVALTAIFAGGVIALQSYTGFSQYHAQNAIAHIVLLAITRELGPVLAGLMIAGRVGAALSAQIGTMRVTNQIDALATLSTDPIKYLVTPRLLAGTLALPLLVLVADILGVFGGFTVSVAKLGFAPDAYITATLSGLKASDVIVGLVKAAVFGFLIALLGCYYGYHSKGGAEGVGAAATATVVGASIMVLIFDYMLTDLFFTG